MALDYGNYGIFLIMGYAGYISSTVGHPWQPKLNFHKPENQILTSGHKIPHPKLKTQVS